MSSSEKAMEFVVQPCGAHLKDLKVMSQLTDVSIHKCRPWIHKPLGCLIGWEPFRYQIMTIGTPRILHIINRPWGLLIRVWHYTRCMQPYEIQSAGSAGGGSARWKWRGDPRGPDRSEHGLCTADVSVVGFWVKISCGKKVINHHKSTLISF